MSFEFLFAALERGLTETDDTVDSLIVGAVRNILNLLMDRMHKHEGTGVLKMVFKSLPRLTCLPVSDILYINTVFSGTISGKAFIEYLF